MFISISTKYPGRISVEDPDPGSGPILTPRSGIHDMFFRIPDLGSRIPAHIFES